jgi:hypothetical protein
MWAWWVNPREIRDGKEPGRFMKRERDRERSGFCLGVIVCVGCGSCM